ncbi:phosphoribosylaminoimidazolesuccinocarboxamide synthase [Halanaerobium hydrogeniformans]|uniref:Phosphoribosylaminoimidazole-succinocarboxamide synthase n=1 Tax=Halanaerobium hydrogeniformans TaxID=656519 RepID=E4RKL1_HALHG|nr:phosphoribosylaminoimidazolesuccinocarboxamide synthase [Halanaerobium hydrogeniformans]ADQ15658.1 phosphoribosylaminoimidazole-succinocarboxamide synthase [Halanaerobium hydrogeniformans]
MEKKEILYEGKAKKIFKTDNKDELIVYFKDDATAFDGQKRGQIENKGIINNKISNAFFEVLEKKGIKTHFIKELNKRETLVKKVDIILIEVVIRNISAGSLVKRLGIEEGIELSKPIVEFYYKNDQLGDPLINRSHIEILELADYEQLDEITVKAKKINRVLRDFSKSKGVDLVDFKLEFGITSSGEIILADEISPDTCRFWDTYTKQKLDKDRFRKDLGDVESGYIEMLQRITGKNKI